MRLRARLDQLLERFSGKMAEKKKGLRISPEKRADWDEMRRQLRERIELRTREEQEWRERETLRRRPLRRLRFGILGRA